MNRKVNFSIYSGLPDDYLEYFEKNLIPLSQNNYSDNMLKALMSLHEAITERKSIGAGICEGMKLKTGKNIAFWHFLTGLPISTNGGDFLNSLGYTNDLAHFCSIDCNGILNIAISGIDTLTRLSIANEDQVLLSLATYEALIFSEVNELIEKKQFYWPSEIHNFPLEDQAANQKLVSCLISQNLLTEPINEYLLARNSTIVTEELQETGSFIRDVYALVSRSKGDDQRAHERRKNLQDQKPLRPIAELNDFFETEATRVLTKVLKSDVSKKNLQRMLKPLYPKRKNSPQYVLAGFCLMCHRKADRDEYYCPTHTKPTKKPEDIGKQDRNKSLKKRIHQAFDNLGYLLLHEKAALIKYPRILKKYNIITEPHKEIRNRIQNNYKEIFINYLKRLGLTEKEILIEKAYFLSGWGMHHPLHKKFYKKLRAIEKAYIKSDNCWSISSLSMLNDILHMSKDQNQDHPHTRDLFPATLGLFQCNEKELGSLLAIQNSMLDGDITELLSPSEFIECINRLSIFKLIEIASSKRKYTSVINKDYLPANLIKSSI
ncbi:hypothetical protein [Cellvibrio sp. KY-YJ-3]|uniref:hypothetical protein n=1 Tax=Cellvibrio sp. KY-YJ-3 TaxID=454662 RepID=UPI00124655FD|nr:hypothetical protein [Cellvibrio sp. KY-YJ-3]QEY13287.1 hypothetical protein D0B88_14155 [Cellvibrio sp. KY-YJ-3]